MLVFVKALHTLVFVVIFAALLFLLYCGLANQLSYWTAIAFALVLAEVIIYVGNGFRCPLKTIADQLTPTGQRATDIYLPSWFSKRIVAISTPLLVFDCLLLLLRLLGA